MADFFEHMQPDDALELERLSQLIFELREHRQAVLRRYGADSPETLLEQIRSGNVSEHPAYEHYLAARILQDTRETARELVGERLQEVRRP